VQSIVAHNSGDRVTLAIRPEKITLGDGGEAQGKVTEAVYLGTDTSYSVALSDDITVAVRDQIDVSGHARFATGDTVGVHLPGDAVRMLLD